MSLARRKTENSLSKSYQAGEFFSSAIICSFSSTFNCHSFYSCAKINLFLPLHWHLSQSYRVAQLLFNSFLHWLLLITQFFLQINLNLNELLFLQKMLLEFFIFNIFFASLFCGYLLQIYKSLSKSLPNLRIKDKMYFSR